MMSRCVWFVPKTLENSCHGWMLRIGVLRPGAPEPNKRMRLHTIASEKSWCCVCGKLLPLMHPATAEISQVCAETTCIRGHRIHHECIVALERRIIAVTQGRSEVTNSVVCKALERTSQLPNVSRILTNASRRNISDIGILYIAGLGSRAGGRKVKFLESCAEEIGLMEVVSFDFCRPLGAEDPNTIPSDLTTLGEALLDTLAVALTLCAAQQLVLVAASLGAWFALHLAKLLPRRVAAIILVGPSVDGPAKRAVPFTSSLVRMPSPHSCTAGYVLPSTVVDELKLRNPITWEEEGGRSFVIPIRILHGSADECVPFADAQLLLAALQEANSPNVRLDCIHGGDHRLSEASDLEKLAFTLKELLWTLHCESTSVWERGFVLREVELG